MKKITQVLSIAIFAALLAPAQSNQAKQDLQAMSKSAVTAKQHEEVAKLYRERATELTAQAVKHEKKAADLMNRPAAPLVHKWPAMQTKPWEKERKLAVQSRRAAEEATQLSARHTQLAAQAETKASEVE